MSHHKMPPRKPREARPPGLLVSILITLAGLFCLWVAFCCITFGRNGSEQGYGLLFGLIAVLLFAWLANRINAVLDWMN